MNTRPRQQILTLIAIALTVGSGATDVASFTRLGEVFTSVMTGNIVLWGLAAARGSLSLASHTAVAIAGYIAGVAGGTWIAHGFKAAGPEKTSVAKPDDEGRASVLPAHVSWALFAELILLAGFTPGCAGCSWRPRRPRSRPCRWPRSSPRSCWPPRRCRGCPGPDRRGRAPGAPGRLGAARDRSDRRTVPQPPVRGAWPGKQRIHSH